MQKTTNKIALTSEFRPLCKWLVLLLCFPFRSFQFTAFYFALQVWSLDYSIQEIYLGCVHFAFAAILHCELLVGVWLFCAQLKFESIHFLSVWIWLCRFWLGKIVKATISVQSKISRHFKGYKAQNLDSSKTFGTMSGSCLIIPKDSWDSWASWDSSDCLVFVMDW